jgi:RimJ/RimL family protein N-acetyltransferase
MTDDGQDYYWQSARIRLREMRKEDMPLWLEEDKDSKGVRLLNPGMGLPQTPADAERFAERYANFNSASDRIMFSIETLAGDLVGGININSIDQRNGTFSTGTRIYRKFRHQGYAREAKILVLRYAFCELRLHKFKTWCIETNKDVIRHQLELGCKQEGRARETVYTEGRYFDEILFGMTKSEFVEKYGASWPRRPGERVISVGSGTEATRAPRPRAAAKAPADGRAGGS